MELDPNYALRARDSAFAQSAEPPKPAPDTVDTSKRYDVYCMEHNQQVVYRNVRFIGVKRLYDSLSQFVELEQADERTIFVARSSIIKFCEHGATPGSEAVPRSGP